MDSIGEPGGAVVVVGGVGGCFFVIFLQFFSSSIFFFDSIFFGFLSSSVELSVASVREPGGVVKVVGDWWRNNLSKSTTFDPIFNLTVVHWLHFKKRFFWISL